MRVFVDASAYLSVLNKKDSNHRKALKISQQFFKGGGELITSNIVIYEVCTVLSLRIDKKLAFEFRETLENSQTAVIYLNRQIENKAWEIFQKQTSKNVSFFDCTSFAVMEELGIKSVFSFDGDFKRYAQRTGISFNFLPV